MRNSMANPPQSGMFRKPLMGNYTTTVVLDAATVEIWRSIPRTFRSPAVRLFLNQLGELINQYGVEKASEFQLVLPE